MIPGFADPAPLIAAAEVAAAAAAAVLRARFRTPLRAERKADESPVTEADRAAEQAMRHVLREAFPNHGVLGEEGGASELGQDFLWVLDPIDGTRAFLTGRPLFTSLIALLHEGRPVLGLIDQPVTRERWIGLAGQKTLFEGPLGGRPGTRRCTTLARAELSCTSPELLGDALPRFQRLAAGCERTSWGGDAYQYGLLSLGLIDIVAERGLKMWDWAALVPVIEGAGGRVTDWQGRRLQIGDEADVIAVGDAALLGPALTRLAV